ncbi:MAG TPA: CaiB/BaiF CoA-transferase family protein, partial [Stellaceae bacterium]|nr:CaiB/BaiF CoA-transferase family protein [Stellaceae bacterium]
VLDLTQFVAGPTCTRIMAELGADVIKVELAPYGDRGRASGDKPRDPGHKSCSQSTYFFQHNHSKKSLAIDIKHPRGRALIRAMVPKVDVVVENFAPGVMARAGLGYDDLRAVNPGLVMCSISLAGQTGPLSQKPGFDYMGAAYAGITETIGELDRGPAQFTTAIGDSAAGIAAAMAVGFALLHRERTGEGQFIDCSLLDSYFHMHEVNVPKVALRGSSFAPQRAGSLHPDGGPTGVFRFGGEEFIAIMVMPHQWQQMVAALSMPELGDDPRFSTARARRDNKEALKRIIERWLSRFPTREAAILALERERVPCAPVLTLAEAMAHPHLRERGTVRRVRDRFLGEFDVPGLPVKFSQWPDRTSLRADLLGEHNEEVLRRFLDVSDADIASLYADKVLVRDPSLDRVSAEPTDECEALADRPGMGV